MPLKTESIDDFCGASFKPSQLACLTTWICCVIQCHIEYFLGEALPQSLAQELTTADGINRLRNKISRHLAAHWST